MQNSAELVISTHGLNKRYNGLEALKSLNLAVARHSIFDFLGPNGAGKTTTIKLLLGLARPSSGTGQIFGRDIVEDSVEIRKQIGYLAQDPRFYEHMTARETLRFKMCFYFRGPAPEIESRIAETLDLVGLADKATSGEHQNDMVTPPSGWLARYDANFLSMVRLIQRLLPPMKERGWGRIINISSAAAVNPSPGMGVYSATKAAVNNLTVNLAQGMSEEGVTVNTVSPGAILTPSMVAMGLEQGMGATAAEVKEAFNQMMGSEAPFPRMGSVDEVANVVVFLASSLASYVHGANIRVDGGWVATVN